MELVRELVGDYGAEISVVVPGDGPLGARLAAAGGEPIRIPGLPWWCAAEPVPRDEAGRRLAAGVAATTGPVLDALATVNPSVVLSFTSVAPWGALAAALSGRPHAWYVTDFGARGGGLHYFLPFDSALEALTEASDEVLVVSRAVRDRLFPQRTDENAPDRVAIVYPHLQVPSDGAGRTASPFRRTGSLKLGVFGSIRDEKGQATAVRALARLRRRGLDAELLVVGTFDQGYRPGFEGLVRDLGLEDDVVVTGPVDDQYAYMRAVDVVLVPSRIETFSLVSLEAMLLEKPLVASEVGGIVEFVRPGLNGFAVAPERPVELADRIEALARDPERARELARAGRREAERRFTAEAFGGEIHSRLSRLAANPGARRRRSLPAGLADLLVRAGRNQRKRLAEGAEAAAALAARALRCEAAAGRLGEELELRRRELAGARRRLEALRSSGGVRLLERYWSWVERLAPEGSRRRRIYHRLFRALR